jgi:hypothetical protein
MRLWPRSQGAVGPVLYPGSVPTFPHRSLCIRLRDPRCAARFHAAFVKSARPAAKLLATLHTIRTGSEKIRGGVGRAVRGSWARTREEIR